jgi:DNA-binding IclR family transcriptional regulator
MCTDMDIVHIAEPADTQVKSAARVLDILELLAVLGFPLGVSDIARRLDMPKSSAHTLLSTLVVRGYVVCDAQRRFGLHPLLATGSPSWVGGFQGPLLRVAKPLMQQLVDATGESALLGRLRDGMTLEYVEKVVTPDALRVDVELGVPRPLHSTSTGQVLLANSPELLVTQYLARMEPEMGPEFVAALRQTLSQVRTRGFAMVSDPRSAYAFGAAAPIRGIDGQIIAALNVSAPAARFHSASDHVIRELVTVASAISSRLSSHWTESADSSDPKRGSPPRGGPLPV